MNIDGKNILITGGTGSFGKAYVEYLLNNYKPNKLVILSRDEQKHYAQKREFEQWRTKVQFVIGDVRDRDKIHETCRGIDIVIHSAAMKHMPMAEEHPMEAIKTNVLGSHNLIDACVANGVQKVVALSTDKAALPINVYGGTKLLLERLFISANAQFGDITKFSAVRYANVFGSKGSVVPLFLKLKASGVLPVTDLEMTRFSITMQQGIDLVQFALEKSLGGDIIVPITKSYRVGNVATAVCEDCQKEIIGPRASEKMHEVLISSFEASCALRAGNYYVLVPNKEDVLQLYLDHYSGKRFEGEEYSSGNNEYFLTVEDIKRQIAELDHE
ncbi:MAG: SDR family NAD(P)-dependent oxidoreductase [Ekhidna sp.]|nr:SDR family NAD(P)-dependent oxidoreductase [Ekhidna sp.]